jgi:hypothetical protein
MLALTHADEKANANSALKNIRKIHLTSHSSFKLLFRCRAAAIAFAPSTPTRFSLCKTHVGPHARRRKSKRSFGTEKHPQNSSYKVQPLHAAVPLQSGSNRLRSLDADFVASLQNSCWPSRSPTKAINLTRFTIFTRLISPVLIRAANATQSASETPHKVALITSLSTSNSLQPNFTFGMEHADAAEPVRRFFTFGGMEHADTADQFTLRPEKSGAEFHVAIALYAGSIGEPVAAAAAAAAAAAEAEAAAVAAAAAAVGGTALVIYPLAPP